MTDQYDETAAAEPGRDEPGDVEHRDATRRETDWQRKRRLAEIFGETLPATTRDERDPGPRGGERRESAGDRWLKSQVPPHHGG